MDSSERSYFRVRRPVRPDLSMLGVVACLFIGLIGCRTSGPLPVSSSAGEAEFSEALTFAIIGDYGGLFGEGGAPNPNVLQVAKLVNEDFCPEILFTIGDNNYNLLNESSYQKAVGDYYGEYGPEPYGEILTPRQCASEIEGIQFFPASGNCDLEPCSEGSGNTLDAYQDYFWWANNEHAETPCPQVEEKIRQTYPGFRCPSTESANLFYDVSRGSVHFFALDSYCPESNNGCYESETPVQCQENVFTDPSSPTCLVHYCTQVVWLEAVAELSPEPWKIVYFHNSPYSSGNHSSCTGMQFDFQALGMTAVITGHSHSYNRILLTGETEHLPQVFLINGLGGGDASTDQCAHSLDGVPNLLSSVLYELDHGAMLGQATPERLELGFFRQSSPDRPLDLVVWTRESGEVKTHICPDQSCELTSFCDCTNVGDSTCPPLSEESGG